jgi:hypothetical protein
LYVNELGLNEVLTYVTQCLVVMPMDREVVPLVSRVAEQTNLFLHIDRRAESGAVVFLAGTAV